MLKRTFQRIKPDILHINFAGVEDGQTLVIAAKMAGIKNIVGTFHSDKFVPYTVMGVRIRVIGTFRKWLTRRLASFIKKMITVSFATAEGIDQEYGISKNKFAVIYNGIDATEYDLVMKKKDLKKEVGFKENKIVVTFIGNLYTHKGVNYLLDAIPDVTKEVADIHFVIVGDGHLLQELIDQAKGLGIDKKVNFMGRRNDIPYILKASDIFVLPSMREGFPYAVLEAMAAELPIVTTKVGGIPEMIRDGEEGILIKPCDSKALSEAITKINKNRKSAERMGVNARTRVARDFGFSEMITSTLAVYDEAVSVQHEKDMDNAL